MSGGSTDRSNTNGIQINREWAMPNSATFEIDPIGNLVTEEVRKSDGLWIDPFAGEANVADVTNDLNPEIESDYTMPALEFLEQYDAGEVDGGVVFDPPYSPRQIKEVYDSIGLETSIETTQATFWSDVKDEIERICASDTTVITCGWNSGGIGKTRQFEIRRILLVAHGGWHNDTLVTVEDHNQGKLSEF